MEQRAGQFDHAGQATEQHHSGDQGETEAGLPGFGLLGYRKLRGEDGDKDDVIDAKDDLKNGQGEQANPNLRSGNPVHHGVISPVWGEVVNSYPTHREKEFYDKGTKVTKKKRAQRNGPTETTWPG